MNLLDLAIIILLIADVIRGARIGFSRQFFSFAGFWGGLLIAALLAPLISRNITDTTDRVVVLLVVALSIGIGLSLLGELLGARLGQLAKRFHVSRVDATLGAIFGGLLVAIGVWVLAAMFLNLPSRPLTQQVQQSKIVRLINRVLPPAPPFIARVQRLIEPNGFPQVFVGPEPQAGGVGSVATNAEVQQAIAADAISTVKIEGVGCGAEISGSGFVVAPGIVVTNAHVIAGIDRPLVLDRDGIHSTMPVEFDPNLDLAVLRVDTLNDPPLKLAASDATGGTHSVVLGFPEGGDFTASPGAVIQSYLATGRNIYDAGLTVRDIYEIEAIVQPGNSGGPLVLPNGTVIGVVFARSEINDSVGYALTISAVRSEILKGETSTGAVSTGACAAE